MTPREILIALHLKHKGDWNKIFKSINDREEIEDSLTKLTEEAMKHRNFITLTDDDKPEVIAKLTTTFRPPFVLEYVGDIDVLNSKDFYMVGVDDKEYAKILLDAGITTGYINKSNKSITIQRPGSIGSTGTADVIEIYESSDTIKLFNVLKDMSSKFLITNAERNEITDMLVSNGECEKIYALPGNSGSFTNFLIKNHAANLCDCAEDLKKESIPF